MTRGAQLALGTVQFGMPYGIAGRGSAVPAREVRDILDRAWECGVRMLDTAPGYGDIEQRLADLTGTHRFEIVSKIPPWPQQAAAGEIASFVTHSIEQSVARLGTKLRVVLFHRGEDLLGAQGEAAWDAALIAASSAGVRLGASFYAPAAACEVRQRFPLAIAQLPGNALDQRLVGSAATALMNVEIHLRSLFLQGLLLLPPGRASQRVPKAAASLQAWANLCAERGVTPLRAALGVAHTLPSVRYCIVGVDRLSQLEEILTAWRVAAPLNIEALASEDEDVIDPRRWEPA